MNSSSAAQLTAPAGTAVMPSGLERVRSDPAYQGYLLLRIGFTVAPILFGIDKYFN